MSCSRHRLTAVAIATSWLLAGVLAGHRGDAAPLRDARIDRLSPGDPAAATLVRAKPRPVYEGADLRNRDFTGANLDGVNFRGAQLQGANFSRARARGAFFEGARLDNAKFVQAQLQRAQFATATFDGADFTGAQLQGADLGGELRGVNLAKANLLGVLFGFGAETQLHGANLDGAILSGADFGRAQLQGASLKAATLLGVDLRGANLQGADLAQADLRGANLDHADLQGASLRGAKLWHTVGSPNVALADLDAVDLGTTTQLTRREIDGIVRLFQQPFRGDARRRLAVLDPAARASRKTPAAATAWRPAVPLPAKLAELLAKVACGWHPEGPDSEAFFDNRVDMRVTRGLLRNGRLAATGDQAAVVVDALRKGRSAPAECPGAAGATDEDWAALDALASARQSPK